MEAVLFSFDDDVSATNGGSPSRKEVETREAVAERMRTLLEGVVLPEVKFPGVPLDAICRRLERMIRNAGGIPSFRLNLDPAVLRATEEDGGLGFYLLSREVSALGVVEEVAAMARATPCFDEDGVVLVPEHDPSKVASVSSRAGRIDVRRRVLRVFDRTPIETVAIVAADTREVAEGFYCPFGHTPGNRLLDETSPTYCLSLRFRLEADPVPIASEDRSFETNGFARVFGTPDTDCPAGTWWLHNNSADSSAGPGKKPATEPATILVGGPSFPAAFGLVWDVREDYTVVFSPASTNQTAQP